MSLRPIAAQPTRELHQVATERHINALQYVHLAGSTLANMVVAD
jgi:hypothetical protein